MVSIDATVNIWCHPDGTFRWQGDDGTDIVRMFEDLEDVTEEAVRHHEELNYLPPS